MANSHLTDHPNYPALFQHHVLANAQYWQEYVTRQSTDIAALKRERDCILKAISFALKLPEAWLDTRALLLTMAPNMEQAGFRDEWIPYLEQGVHQSQRLHDAETEAELYIQLGILFQLRGKYEVARSYLETSVKGFAALNNSHGQARACNQLAFVAQRQRRFKEATDLVETALQLLSVDDSEQAFSYFVLGMVALGKRTWPEAVDFFQKSFELWEHQNNHRMMGRTLTLLGSALNRMERYTEAIKTYQRAINLLETVDDPVHKGMAQMNLGNVYVLLSRLQEALESHLQAEKIFRKVQDQLHLAHVTHNIGMVYRRLQQWPKAEEAFGASIKLWERFNNVERLVNTMDGLGLVHFEQGHFTKAKAVFEEALNQLRRIEGEPGYDHKFNMVTSHLKETCAAMVQQQEQTGNFEGLSF
jgi:tetratricopeptide (TPR) repeat protein